MRLGSPPSQLLFKSEKIHYLAQRDSIRAGLQWSRSSVLLKKDKRVVGTEKKPAWQFSHPERNESRRDHFFFAFPQIPSQRSSALEECRECGSITRRDHVRFPPDAERCPSAELWRPLGFLKRPVVRTKGSECVCVVGPTVHLVTLAPASFSAKQTAKRIKSPVTT